MLIDKNDKTINVATRNGIWINAENIAKITETDTQTVIEWALSDNGVDSCQDIIINDIKIAAEASIAKQMLESSKKFDVVLIEKPDTEPITAKEYHMLLALLNEDEFFNINIEETHVPSYATGVITKHASEKLGHNTKFLQGTITAVIDDMNLETPNGVYTMQGLSVKILR